MANVRELKLAAQLLAQQTEEKAASASELQDLIYWNVYQASIHFGETQEAIRKGLRDLNLEIGPGWTYTTQEIYKALTGNLKSQRTRVEKEKADKMERERKLDEGQMLEWERVNGKLNQYIKLPMQNAFDNAPTAVDREWLEKVLKPILMQSLEQMRDEIVEERKRES